MPAPSSSHSRSAATGRGRRRPACRRRRRRRPPSRPSRPRRACRGSGPELSTGEAIRTRRFAWPIRFAIRCASASPCSGVNHGRTSMPPTSTGRGSTWPEPITSPVSQSSSKLSPYAYASSTESGDRDHVLLARPGVLRPVHRAGPDRLAVAHDVLVVHQVGHAGDRPRRDRERLEQLGCGLRRRRHRDRARVVDVVDEPHRDAALLRADERSLDDLGRLVVESDVVERELEARACGAEELGDLVRDVDGALPAVAVEPEVDQPAAARN